ncbi:MAG: alpha/beta hydrolase family protein [Phycisphaerales bacterium]
MSTMEDRFTQLPSALRERTHRVELAGVPALVAIPDETPAPVMVWMHGRTVDKELDPGRYLRWVRAGIAAISLDLPGHGERPGPRLHDPDCTPEILEQMQDELDTVLDAARSAPFADRLRFDRMGIGGMSAGGMVALRRLCDEHPFRCAAVESTTGWLAELYEPTLTDGRPWPVDHDPQRIARIDPMAHLSAWRPVPLLALHTEADRTVPIAGMRAFLDELRGIYAAAGSDPGLIELRTWPETGAPSEHAGFGRVAAEAKNIQTEFLARHLLGRAAGG